MTKKILVVASAAAAAAAGLALSGVDATTLAQITRPPRIIRVR